MDYDERSNWMKEVTFSLKNGGKVRWSERRKEGVPPEVK
jgi:hypothetical protein